jgi:hypothetical protein
MDGKVTCSWVQGSHTTDTSKSITFSAEPGSFGAIESNKDSCPPELGCGWPEPGSPARPCRALKSNSPFVSCPGWPPEPGSSPRLQAQLPEGGREGASSCVWTVLTSEDTCGWRTMSDPQLGPN